MKTRLLLPIVLLASGWFLPPAVGAADTGPILRIGNGVPTVLAAAPGNAEVAVGGSLGVWLLDAHTLAPQRLLRTEAWVKTVRYSADGRYLQANDLIYDRASEAWTAATATDITWLDSQCVGRYCFAGLVPFNQEAALWVKDTQTGVNVQQVTPYARTAAWAQDGSRFYVLLDDDALASWAFQPGPGVAPWLAHQDSLFVRGGEFADWSADSAGLAVDGQDWDVANGQVTGPACPWLQPGGGNYVCGLAFSIQLTSNHDLYVYDDPAGQAVRSFVPHHIVTTNAAASSDGRWLVTSGADTLSVANPDNHWDAFTPAVATTVSTRLWDRATQSEVARLPLVFYALAIAPHGDVVIGLGLDGVQAWNTRTGQITWHLPGRAEQNCPLDKYAYWYWCYQDVGSAAFSPDGQLVAVAAQATGNDVWLLRASTGERVARLTGHTSAPDAPRFSPDGHRVAASGSDGQTLIWDVPAH